MEYNAAVVLTVGKSMQGSVHGGKRQGKRTQNQLNFYLLNPFPATIIFLS